MASRIQSLLNSILTAVYGRDVRQSIHDAIEECYSDVSTAKTSAQNAINNVGTAITNANTATTRANNAATAANNAASSAASSVSSAITAANTAAENANTKAALADQKATLADQKAAAATTAAANADTAAASANAAVSSFDYSRSRLAETLTSLQEALADADQSATNANAAASSANTAASNANVKAAAAQTAAEYANTSAGNAVAAVSYVQGTTATAHSLTYGTPARVEESTVNNHLNLDFYIPEGRPGKSSIIIGEAYPSLTELQNNVTSPEAGDMYNVGTEPPYNIYRWTGSNWEDQGQSGFAIDDLTTVDIDTMWGGDNPLPDDQRYLDNNGLWHLINTKLKPTITSVQTEWEEASATLESELNDIHDLLDEVEADVETVNTKAAQIINVTTSAEEIASRALQQANNIANETAEYGSQLDTLLSDVETIKLQMATKLDDAYVEDGFLYMLANSAITVGPLGPFSGGGGGGGGGGGNQAVITVTNTSGWLSKKIAESSSCYITITWSSIEDGIATGDGTMEITVNGVLKSTQQIQQGEVTFDIARYCSNGTNVCKVKISDIYGNSRPINYSIEVQALSISSSFDTSVVYTGPISFPYTPVGSLNKIIYFILDGRQIGTQETSVSNRQMTYVIPAQTHGSHSLRVYFEVDIDGQIVRSNELYFEFISAEQLDNTVVITSSFNLTSVNQYSSLLIPYRVYDPLNDTTAIQIYINDVPVSSQTVDRTEQTYAYRASTPGQIIFKITAGNAQPKEVIFTVNAVSIDVEAETEDLVLYLNAEGRSNNEATRDVWEYNDISAQFTDFNWVLDGWQVDSDGASILRLVDDARITIPYEMFGTDFKANGKTIEIEFATRQVSDYSATIFSCMSDNIGLEMTPQSVVFKGAQNEISTLYKENEHVRLTIVVEKQTANRLILVYINGVMSRAIQYASGERFSQLNPVNITIGSNACGIDIYAIRVYDNDLNRQQVLDNWIADTQNGELMLERYSHNQIYNNSGEVSIANLPANLPYWIIECPELPQYKGDKKTCSGSFTVPGNSAKSFTFTGCQINVQGTSSAVYYRKNYDMQFKGGFDTTSGNVSSYAIRTNSIPFNRFVLKADVASSESANNTELTMFYNDTCPYRTPAMHENPQVRYGIEGIPTVVFWYNPDNQTTSFMGKYNFNLPKRAPEPYGYSSDGTLESWEFERNNSANVKFQDDDFISESTDELGQTYPTWYDDWEARFPSDEWRDYTKLKEFISWVKLTWREAATNETFSEPVVYRLNTVATLSAYTDDQSYTVTDEIVNGQNTGYKLITFTKDTPAYRLTKFRAEAQDCMEIDSAVFYYLFTELFLMIDSRAKNMFVGFDGGLIGE